MKVLIMNKQQLVEYIEECVAAGVRELEHIETNINKRGSELAELSVERADKYTALAELRDVLEKLK